MPPRRLPHCCLLRYRATLRRRPVLPRLSLPHRHLACLRRSPPAQLRRCGAWERCGGMTRCAGAWVVRLETRQGWRVRRSTFKADTCSGVQLRNSSTFCSAWISPTGGAHLPIPINPEIRTLILPLPCQRPLRLGRSTISQPDVSESCGGRTRDCAKGWGGR